jgi:hypothetical protein
VKGGWRKLHNKELCDLYSLPSIIRMIKFRRMRRAEHVQSNHLVMGLEMIAVSTMHAAYAFCYHTDRPNSLQNRIFYYITLTVYW